MKPSRFLDLRNTFEWQEGRIPGALSITDEELDTFISANVETGMLILYCSCPNEISSAAAAAVKLKRRDVKFVHTLEGGFPLWMRLGFPVEASA